MTFHIKTGGAWQEIDDPQVKVAGAWQEVNEGWVKVAGVWQQFYERSAGAFAPTNNGQISVDGVLVSGGGTGTDAFGTNPASAFGEAGIWVEVTSTNAYIYCGAEGGGSPFSFENVNWNDDTGAAQGDPGDIGVGTSVFTLGERPDQIEIDTVTVVSGVTMIGSFTDGVAFSPTNGVQYGYYSRASASVAAGGGSDFDTDGFTVDITFKKAGYADYTIRFQASCSASASSGPS